MKSYTDISQSHKLTEILPLESADMHWQYIEEDDGQLQWFYFPKDFSINQHDDVPCWSLAALIDILPQFIEFKGNKYYLRFMKEYVEYANDEISITGRCLHTTGNYNLVDACVEMILKLKENKLL